MGRKNWCRMTIALGLLMLASGIYPAGAQAALSVYESGVGNDQQYQEVVFITGQPLLLTGELKISQGREKDGISTSTYYYKLEDAAGEVKLTRRLTLTTTRETSNQQSVEVTELNKITETIAVTQNGAKDNYTLKDDAYKFHKSVVTDHKPAVDYFSGNWNGRKVYDINKDEGEAVVEITGSTVGYNHYWGATETQLVDYYLETDRTTDDGDRVQWTGTAQVKLALNRTKDLTYVANEPTPISFRGGYLQTEQEENVLEYSYDLPRFDGTELVEGRRTRDEDSFKLMSVPTQKRLTVSAVRDIGGSFAEEDIARLMGLGAFKEAAYFGPTLPMQRGEFARALAIITNMVPSAETPATTARGRQAAPTPTAVFVDVPVSHQDYAYIAEVEKRGVMRGEAGNRFFPDGALTRAEAVTILVRALGFEGLAPMAGYQTSYRDDAEIPLWAQDAVYVGTELGLVQGDGGYFYPNDRVTKAEAAAFLNRLITFLQGDLKEYYRERVIYQH